MRAIQGFWSVVALFTFVSLSPQRTRAENDALTQRLEALDDNERTLLAPQLERGAVGLVEFSHGDTLPAVLVASYVEAPADLAAQIIGSPGEYPKFMKILDHVEVLSKSGAQTAYKWSWQTGVLFLEGENRMTAFAPPPDKPELGHRIAVKSERGQLGEGRLMWRVLPVTKQRSLVMLSMRVDMRDANFVMRQLDAAAKSVNRSVNIALCYVMLLGAKREAERRAGSSVALPAQVAFDPPRVDIEKLHGLLARADLLLMELTPKGLGKLSIVGLTDVPRARIEPIINEPEMFGKSLVPGSYTRVTKREGSQKTFEWGIGLPLIGTSGTMVMRNDKGTVGIEATEGALKGGRWRFDTPTLRSGEAVVVGYSQFDITKASWLIEKITSFDPVLGHGLAAATQVMLLRALRKRAHDESLITPGAGTSVPVAAPVSAGADAGVDAGLAVVSPDATVVAPDASVLADAGMSDAALALGDAGAAAKKPAQKPATKAAPARKKTAP